MKSPDENYMLVVEDSDEDFEALKRVMTKSCDRHVPVVRCVDGEEALELLYEQKLPAEQTLPTSQTTLPSLILLDLNLPGTDGREVLAQLKQDESTRAIPIVIFTTSSNPKDIEACYQYGVNSYLIKPMRIDQLKTSISTFVNYWFNVVVLPSTPVAL